MREGGHMKQTKTDVTPKEWIADFVWSGYCLRWKMWDLWHACKTRGDSFDSAPFGAEEVLEQTYEEFRNEKGMSYARAIMKYHAYLTMYAGRILETAAWVISLSEQAGGKQADATRKELERVAVKFEEMTKEVSRKDEAATYLVRMLKTDTYDIEFLRMAKELDRKMFGYNASTCNLNKSKTFRT